MFPRFRSPLGDCPTGAVVGTFGVVGAVDAVDAVDAFAAVGALGAIGDIGALAAFGAAGVGAFGAVGALAAVGAIGAIGADGSLRTSGTFAAFAAFEAVAIAASEAFTKVVLKAVSIAVPSDEPFDAVADLVFTLASMLFASIALFAELCGAPKLACASWVGDGAPGSPFASPCMTP